MPGVGVLRGLARELRLGDFDRVLTNLVGVVVGVLPGEQPLSRKRILRPLRMKSMPKSVGCE